MSHNGKITILRQLITLTKPMPTSMTPKTTSTHTLTVIEMRLTSPQSRSHLTLNSPTAPKLLTLSVLCMSTSPLTSQCVSLTTVVSSVQPTTTSPPRPQSLMATSHQCSKMTTTQVSNWCSAPNSPPQSWSRVVLTQCTHATSAILVFVKTPLPTTVIMVKTICAPMVGTKEPQAPLTTISTIVSHVVLVRFVQLLLKVLFVPMVIIARL